MTRRKWFKVAGWLVAFVVVAGAGLWGTSYVMLRRTPEWYQPDISTDEQKSKAAKAFEDVLASIHNWGGKRRAIQYRKSPAEQTKAASRGVEQARAILGEKPDEAFKISFTDEQLNAFFNKWASTHNRREWFEKYVEDPRVVLREKQLIFAGKIKDSGVIVSLVFQPRLEPNGDINMNLVHVFGGTLPVPDAAWGAQRTSIENTLKSKLPAYQQGAAIASDSTANGDAGAAAMNELLLATLNYKSASPVIFVPLEINLSQNLPVKITAFAIHDHTIEMTAEQLSEEERDAFLKRLEETDQEPGKEAGKP